MEDGKLTATINAHAPVLCLAASRDGRYIAGGTSKGHVQVWDAETHEQVFEKRLQDFLLGRRRRFLAGLDPTRRRITVDYNIDLGPWNAQTSPPTT